MVIAGTQWLANTLAVGVVLGVILLFDVPIIGLVVLPSSICTLFWLRTEFDANDEGSGNCTSPRCSLMFTMVSYVLSIPLLIFDILVNAKELWGGRESSQFHSTAQRSRFPHSATLLLDLSMLVLATIIVFMTKNFDSELARAFKNVSDASPVVVSKT
jgi:hypothetical protein